MQLEPTRRVISPALYLGCQDPRIRFRTKSGSRHLLGTSLLVEVDTITSVGARTSQDLDPALRGPIRMILRMAALCPQHSIGITGQVNDARGTSWEIHSLPQITALVLVPPTVDRGEATGSLDSRGRL